MAEACFTPDSRDLVHTLAVIRAFLEEQGADLNGGVVLRAFRPYPALGTDEHTGMPAIEERRVFVWRGRPLVVRGDEGNLRGDRRLAAALGRVRSPFVSVDLARLDDRSWEVVELGDGQVSGLRDADPLAFFRALRGALGSSPSSCRRTPILRRQSWGRRRMPAFQQWLGILDEYGTFWVDPEEDTIEEFEYLMAGK